MRFKILNTNCKKKGIDLTFAPVLMSRHRSNISFYYTKEKILFWVVELVYFSSLEPSTQYHQIIGPLSEQSPLSSFLERFKWENNAILSDLSGHYSTVPVDSFIYCIRNTYNKGEVEQDSTIKESLKEQILDPTNEFVILKHDLCLEEFLRDLEIHEFPTIYVMKKEALDEFKTQKKVVKVEM